MPRCCAAAPASGPPQLAMRETKHEEAARGSVVTLVVPVPEAAAWWAPVPRKGDDAVASSRHRELAAEAGEGGFPFSSRRPLA